MNWGKFARIAELNGSLHLWNFINIFNRWPFYKPIARVPDTCAKKRKHDNDSNDYSEAKKQCVMEQKERAFASSQFHSFESSVLSLPAEKMKNPTPASSQITLLQHNVQCCGNNNQVSHPEREKQEWNWKKSFIQTGMKTVWIDSKMRACHKQDKSFCLHFMNSYALRLNRFHSVQVVIMYYNKNTCILSHNEYQNRKQF